MRAAGSEAALVASEVDRERGDLVGGAEPAERLARDERGARVAAERLDPAGERRGVDRAGADAVAADTAGDKVERDGAGQRDDGALGRAVDVAVGCRLAGGDHR